MDTLSTSHHLQHLRVKTPTPVVSGTKGSPHFTLVTCTRPRGLSRNRLPERTRNTFLKREETWEPGVPPFQVTILVCVSREVEFQSPLFDSLQ